MPQDDILMVWNMLIGFVSFLAGGILVYINGWLWWAGLLGSFFGGWAVGTYTAPQTDGVLGWYLVGAYLVGWLVFWLIVDPFIVDPIKESRKERDREKWRREYIEKHGTDPYEKHEVWEGGEA
jgi:hypothetical protein